MPGKSSDLQSDDPLYQIPTGPCTPRGPSSPGDYQPLKVWSHHWTVSSPRAGAVPVHGSFLSTRLGQGTQQGLVNVS